MRARSGACGQACCNVAGEKLAVSEGPEPAPDYTGHGMQGHRAPIAHMAVDASGSLLAAASADKSAKVWDIEGGFCTHSFTGHRSAASNSSEHAALIPQELPCHSSCCSGLRPCSLMWELSVRTCHICTRCNACGPAPGTRTLNV